MKVDWKKEFDICLELARKNKEEGVSIMRRWKMNKTEEKPEEKVDRLMLEAMEIANEHGIPYIAATKRRSILTGGTPRELLALSVYEEVQIAKEIKLPIEDMIRNVTRGIEIAYRKFEELGRQNEAEGD